ncbi:hypothetical protein [Effusibacillus pohliae]|uniref:hypothetical protein n=1 Tax=Effusibacillus pohliae TaxID=232270 RepID=UPI00037052D4|nr:hypothetical protein [Effusibacillus pohliae]
MSEPLANQTGQRASSAQRPASPVKHKKERGGTLFLTCMLLLIGTILLAGLFGLAAAGYRSTLASLQSAQVRYISEAGIVRAIARLDAEPNWRNGWQAVPFGAGTFTVRIEDGGLADSRIGLTQQTAPRFVTIHSDAGIPPRAKHKIRVVYDLQQKKIVKWAE